MLLGGWMIKDLGSHYLVTTEDFAGNECNKVQDFSTKVEKPVCHVSGNVARRLITRWFVNGHPYNPSGPSIEIREPHSLIKKYSTKTGNTGNNNGPASVNHLFGIRYEEDWINESGLQHNDNGPASTTIHYNSDIQRFSEFVKSIPEWHKSISRQLFPVDTPITCIKNKYQVWKTNGKYSSNGSWNHQIDENICERVELNPTTSNDVIKTTISCTRELRWYNERGELHRTDGPAFISLTAVKEVIKNGKMFPWQTDCYHTTWYINGTGIPFIKIKEWAKKHRIQLNLYTSCYDRSAFRTKEDEFLFLADFS